MLDLRPIFLVNGILLMIVAATMLLPAGIDYLSYNDDWKVFITSACLTFFIGFSMYLTNRGYKGALTIRQAFLLTSSSWMLCAAFGAIPLYLSSVGINYTQAYFEATSGLTTTGSTTIVGLDVAPPGILLWRALLQALGGVGIVVLALAILPILRVGGMQLFKTESSDNAEKMLPKATHLASAIATVSLSLTGFCALGYWMAGMNGFDAICHAFSTVATGGFANYDMSLGYFNNTGIEIVGMAFMLAGALPLMLYFQVVRGNPMTLLRNSQVRWYLSIIAFVIALLTLWLVSMRGFEWPVALRQAAFNVISVITTTGFVTTDYGTWGPFAMVVFFMLTVVGGCTGSTSGGIKVFRFQVLFESVKGQIYQLIQPHGVYIPKYNAKPIPPGVINDVSNFFAMFAFSFLVLSVALSFFDLDFVASLSSVAQAMANTGPGLGPIVGPVGNFSTVPEGGLWILSFAMILGRLELFTVLVLFSPRFWRE